MRNRERGARLRLLLLQLGCMLTAVAPCQDSSSWTSAYGENCTWYAQNDVGCQRFADIGQLENCKSTCANCDDSRLVPDPLVTTCSVADLCNCFENCDPKVLCPLSDEAQQCSVQVLDTQSWRTPEPDEGHPYVEWRFSPAEKILGFELRGRNSSWVKTVSAQYVGIADDEVVQAAAGIWMDVDNGRRMAANWEDQFPVRVSFAEAVQATALRLLAGDVPNGSSDPLPMEAKVLLERCQALPEPLTELGRCNLLKCKAYCYRSLGCEGEWEAHCEREKLKDGDFCNVDCSNAKRLGSMSFVSIVSVAVYLFTAMLAD